MKNTFVKVLSFLMALTMIVGMFTVMTVSAAECDHVKGEQVGETVPATCANFGYTLYECTKCGETFAGDIVPKTKEHTSIVDVEATDATCVYPAMTAGQYCEVCGLAVKGSERKPVKDSEPLGHTFEGVSTGSLCERVYSYECVTCKLSYEDAAKAYAKDLALQAFLAAYPEFTWDYAADAEKYGKTIAATGHTWEYEVKTPSTVCVDGVVVRTCEDCDVSEEVALLAPHSYNEYNVANGVNEYALCGEYIGQMCQKCGAPHPTAIPNIYVGYHDWTVVTEDMFNTALQKLGYTKYTISKAANCAEAGYFVRYCADCKTYEQVTVPASAHAWSAVKTTKTVDTPTCGNDSGYEYYRECPVCEKVEVISTVAPKGHVLTTTVVPAGCATEGRTIDTCIVPGCGYTNEHSFTEATGHVWSEDTVKSGRYLANGVLDHSIDYVVSRYCVKCSDLTAETPVYVWDATYQTVIPAVEAVVVEGVDTYPCDYDSYISKTVASCSERSAYIQKCTISGCAGFQYVKADGTVSVDGEGNPLPVYVGEFDKSVHTHGANLTPKNGEEAATCAKEGYKNMYCTTCQTDVKVTLPKVAHTWSTKYDHGADGKMNTANDKDFRAKEPTCTTPGQTAGVVCKVCGTTKVAPKTLPKDPTNHADTKGTPVTVENGKAKVLQTVAKNCQNPGWDKVYYPCCDTTAIEYKDGSTEPANHLNVTVYKANKVTCEKDGNHLYTICNDCGVLEVVETATLNGQPVTCNCGTDHTNVGKNYIILATGHTNIEPTYVPKVDETCDQSGHTAYWVYMCTAGTDGAPCADYTANGKCEHACGCKDGYKVLLKHGDSYVDYVYEKAPTCTSAGINIFANDTTDVVYATSTYRIKTCTKCETGFEKVYPVAHDFQKTEVNKDSVKCNVPTFDAYECSECGLTYSDNYKAAKFTDHRYDTIKHTYAVKTDATGSFITLDGTYITDTEGNKVPACAMPTFSFQFCVNGDCDEMLIDVATYKPAVTHYSTETGEKIEITWSCVGIEESLNLTCDLCNRKVVASDVEHNRTHSKKDATCLEDGYDLYLCVDCGLVFDKNGNVPNNNDASTDNDSWYNFEPALGHNPYDVGSYDDNDNFVVGALDGVADYRTTGNIITNSIYAVNSSVKHVISAKKATAFADGHITYVCARCDETVTVVIPATNALDLVISTEDLIVNNGTATINVAVSANEFSFNTLSIAFVYDDSVLCFKSAELAYTGFAATDAVTVVARNNGSYATVNVYVPNGVDGLPKNAVINGEEVAFLTLTFDVLPNAITYTDDTVVMGAYLLDAGVINEKGILVDKETSINYEIDEDVVHTFLADVNGDNRIDAGDSIAIMSLLYSGEYNVAADINGDGVVDLADHVAILSYNVSNGTFWSYLEIMGVTIESVVADFNLSYDFNNDKTINDTDKAMLVAAIKKAVGYYDLYELAYNTIEELVADVADQLAHGQEIELEFNYQ